MSTRSLTFFTPQELDPFLSSIVNARFYAFMGSFCKANHIDFAQGVETARRILQDAEIPQADI